MVYPCDHCGYVTTVLDDACGVTLWTVVVCLTRR